MHQDERRSTIARIAEIDGLLARPEAVRIQWLVDGPKSMARLTDANLRAFEAQVDRLADPPYADAIIDDPFGADHRLFVERLQHLAANYLLSAVPFLEHLELHVRTHYPDESQVPRLQYQLGLENSVRSYDGHPVVVQLRHMVVHRQLPTVTLVRSPHVQQPVAATIDRRELLADSRCRGAVRALLESLPDNEISLDGLLRDDGAHVMAFAAWFFRLQGTHHLEEIMPIWRLREERELLVASLAP